MPARAMRKQLRRWALVNASRSDFQRSWGRVYCYPPPPAIASFSNGLFELWLEANRRKPTANIRIISDMITALLGNNSPTEGVGHKPVELCTVMTDSSVEAHDVLRIAGDGFTHTRFNIFEHAIDEVRNEPRWKAARDASINLSDKCKQCKFMN